MEIISKVTHILRHLLYDFVLKSVCRPYCLVSVQVKEPQRKTLLLYTHYEGLQVIDEICVRGQYSRAFERQYRVVVDLGAHIGVFSVLYAKDAPRGTTVVAVEPVSVNYNLLLANILANGLSGIVHPIKAAIAPKQGFLDVE